MKNSQFKYIVLVAVPVLFACKKLVEVEPPKTNLVNETVFHNNSQATAAVAGMYVNMRTSGYASGAMGDISTCGGLSSDELTNYFSNTRLFFENQLTSDYTSLQGLYSSPYRLIFIANTITEGLAESTGITPPVKAQLQGEALFVRAFNYFYLVNLQPIAKTILLN